MKILAIQPNILVSKNVIERTSNVDLLSKKIICSIENSPESSIDLVVLPELSTIECTKEAYENLGEISEDVLGETFIIFSGIAKKYSTYISYGLPRKENGNYYISNIVINKNGSLETYYDKIHIAQFGYSIEKDYFKSGDSCSVFDIGGFRIGVIICYDFRFPEYVKYLVENLQVNFILHPVAFKVDETFASWHHFVVTRALENQVYFLSLNRAGEQWGESIFCPPWIDGVSNPEIFGKQEQDQIFELNINDIEKVRAIYNFSEDRLDNYKLLSEVDVDRLYLPD